MREGRECISLGHFKEAILELGAAATTDDDNCNPFVQLKIDTALMMAIHSSVVYMMRMKRNNNVKKVYCNNTGRKDQMIQVCASFTLPVGSNGALSDFVMWLDNKFSWLPILTRMLRLIYRPSHLQCWMSLFSEST